MLTIARRDVIAIMMRNVWGEAWWLNYPWSRDARLQIGAVYSALRGC